MTKRSVIDVENPQSFAEALTVAREGAHLSKTQLAHALRTYPNSVYRWEKQNVVPSVETRIEILRALARAPRRQIERLAAHAQVDLASIGMGAPVPAPPVVAQAPAPPVPPVIPATAQATVDDALREAAEEIDVAPKVLRPALSRMLDRLARAGLPLDAAARMVLGVPKKPASEEKST
jgi:DNA-binding XRE family transcriptional regulator